MSGDALDSPFVETKPAIEEISRNSSCSTARVVLSFWATPMFLYYLFSPFMIASMFNAETTWIFAIVFVWLWAFGFVAAYVGMMFRKIWAYFLCAIYAGWWIVQPFVTLNPPEALNGEGPPFEGLFLLSEAVFLGTAVLYAVPILILSVVCGLSAWQSRKNISSRTSSTANITF